MICEVGELDDKTEQPDKLDNYTIGRPLGKGGFAWVYLGQHKESKKLCTVKISFREDFAKKKALLPTILHEVNVLKELECVEHIPKFHSFFWDNKRTYSLFNFLPGVSLNKLKPPENIDHIRPRMKDIVKILMDIHQSGYVHRDIKPENILLNVATHQISIIDFGSCKKIGVMTNFHSTSQLFWSPELYQSYLENVDSDLEVMTDPNHDIWALAVTCYEVFGGRHPFEPTDICSDQYYTILSDNILNIKFEPVKDKTLEWINQVFVKDPNDRPSLQEIYELCV